jgi:hypothetical protein
MIQQTTGSGHKNIHAFCKPLGLGAPVGATNNKAVCLRVLPVLAQFSQHAVNLEAELAGRRDDNAAGSCVKKKTDYETFISPNAVPDMCAPFRLVNWTLDRSSTAGTKNASVFPDPVFAAPKRSLPARSGAIDLSWILVIKSNPIATNAAEDGYILLALQTKSTVDAV